ncbi:anti-sigma factor domain-containing protein [Paenibacillus pini]|uniref:Anti-sigma-W factor RsiW n=1 Tax=Paenibacillus pini JCM 16418 TaxID=1236976 RepID=W7YPC6_9BACL|nr:anti-sigma factor [Paenibacillus pini]GAF09473.1 hypothetical protein JCM16418_3615 [Paenibacillus pini JCM 16418]
MNERENERCDWAEMYAIGGLDPAETAEFEEHLQTCAACQELVQELREVVGLLPLAVEDVQPPEGMKARILGSVLANSTMPEIDGTQGMSEHQTLADQGESLRIIEHDKAQESVNNADPRLGKVNEANAQAEAERGTISFKRESEQPNGAWIPARNDTRRGSLLLWRTVSIGLAAAIAGLAMYTTQLQRDVNGLHNQLAISDERAGLLNNQLSAMKQPAQGLKADEAVQLSPTTKDIVAQGLATVVIDDKGTHLVVQAEKLPELKGNEAFQVWLIKGDVKLNAGTFVANKKGTGAVYYTFDPDEYDTVAITLEPDAKGQQPRGTVILAGSI